MAFYNEPETNNFLQRITAVSDPSYMRQAAPSAPAPFSAPQEPARKRRSVVDYIGGIADTFAEIGGATPMYQRNIDRRTERERGDELYPLEKQKLELGNRSTQQEMTFNQNEFLGRVAQKLAQVRDAAGPEAAARLFGSVAPQLGMSPQEAQAASAQILADPTVLDAWSTFEEGKDGPKYGLVPVKVTNRATGETKLVQMSSAGGMLDTALPPGWEVEYPLQFNDQGGVIQGTSRANAAPVGAPQVKSGGPATNEVPVFAEDGTTIVGYRAVPGSKLATEQLSEATGEERAFEGRAVSFDTAQASIDRIREGLEVMRKAGVLIDPDSPTQGKTGRAKATLYNAAPWIEGIVNEDGSTGRDLVSGAAIQLTRAFDAVKTEVANSGETSNSARLMDTIKEAQANLEKTVNTRNYKSAMENLSAYEADMKNLQGLLDRYLTEAKTKRARLQGDAPTPKAPTVSNW